MTRDSPSRRRILQAAGATLAAIGSAGLVSTSTAAQTDDNSPPQGLLSDGIDVEGGDRVAFVQGFTTAFSVTPAPDSRTLAERMQNEFNANAGSWLEYGNWLIDSYDDVEPIGTVSLGVTVAIDRFWPRDDERVETVIEATFDDETNEYTGLEWSLRNAGEEVDYEVTLTGTAARNAADELQTFRTEFIDESGADHDLPDSSYVSHLAGRYSPSIYFGSESQHVLQLLMGEFGGEI